jgi:hypothetical protein
LSEDSKAVDSDKVEEKANEAVGHVHGLAGFGGLETLVITRHDLLEALDSAFRISGG